jgi:general stress protein YciG
LAEETEEEMTEKPKARRGFAAMDPELRRAIARKGGAAVPKEKRSFAANRELASSAGKLGGCNSKPEKRSFSRSPELARRAGRKGGIAAQKRKAEHV